MSQDSSAWKLEHTIPSERSEGCRILEELMERFEAQDWSSRDLFGIRLALEEAIVNAIKHGNCQDINKHVHVICHSSAEKIWIMISDEGAGFKPEEVPDCTNADRLEVPSGRGILLMRNYMSHVEYNQTGNVVVMEKLRKSSC